MTNGSPSTSLSLGFAALASVMQLVIDLLVLVERDASAVVVHADEDAQHVGLQIERVLLPALLQIEHRVAADAAIDEVELRVRKRRAVPGGDDEDIAVPQDVVRVRTAPAIAVGDRVALEQDARAGRERGDWFGGVQRDHRRQQKGNGEGYRNAMGWQVHRESSSEHMGGQRRGSYQPTDAISPIVTVLPTCHKQFHFRPRPITPP